jgi:hypothetical protein
MRQRILGLLAEMQLKLADRLLVAALLEEQLPALEMLRHAAVVTQTRSVSEGGLAAYQPPRGPFTL